MVKVGNRSRGRLGRSAALTAVVLGLTLVGAACSSGTTATPLAVKTGGGSSAPSTGAGSSTPDATSAAGSTPTNPAAAGTGAPATSSPTTRSSHATTPATTPASHSSGTQATTPATRAPSAGSSGPAPTAPGTYSYSLVGSGSTSFQTSQGSYSLPAQSSTTLSVTQSGSTETWSNQVSSMNLVFTSNGVFLTSETLVGPGTTCTFSSPLALPPWPVAPGKVSSATANCGGSTLQAVVQVTSGGGGTYTVKFTQTLGGSLMVVETDSYSVARRMPVATIFKITGSYGGASFVTNSSYLLAS